MLTTYDNLHHFFHNSVDNALINQHVKANDYTKIYIVNLLTSFSRSENFFENTEHGLGLKPLTQYYQSAIYTQSKHERIKFLQRLGDVALFIAGIFSDSLNRRNIDIEFYIAMGGNAYSYLSEINDHEQSITAQQAAFHELGNNFITFVDVLAEIGGQTCEISHIDLLKQYDLWHKTGSKRAERLLKKFGVQLEADLNSRYQH